jgi:hypothetical protein
VFSPSRCKLNAAFSGEIIMRALAVSILAAVTVLAAGGLSQDARADGVSVRHAKKVHPAVHARRCGLYDRCGFPVACPSGACYSLYSAYPPYGGPRFWSQYTYSGWGYR